jgi:hypothetical protein
MHIILGLILGVAIALHVNFHIDAHQSRYLRESSLREGTNCDISLSTFLKRARMVKKSIRFPEITIRQSDRDL